MEFATLAQAVGEEPMTTAFVPGEDFDPWNAEDVEIVEVASAKLRADHLRALERENAELRALLTRYGAFDADDHGGPAAGEDVD